MPRPLNPANIITGPGKAAPGTPENLVLVGAGMVGAPPNIGVPGHLVSGVPVAGLPTPSLSSNGSIAAHLQDPKGAHLASAISLDGQPSLITSENVEGAIDELMGAIAPEPPKLGQWSVHMASRFSGLPDWGSRRLVDGLTLTPPPGGALSWGSVYPSYWTAPTPTSDSSFSVGYPGEDPYTDPVWNHVSSLMGTSGGTKAGGYTDATSGEVVRTRLIPAATAAPWGTPEAVPAVCVSGSLYPADRGVLALLHFPDPQSGDSFLDQDLDERVWGALLLGQGLYTSTFCASTPGGLACDGDPGGIFQLGLTDGAYDPFAFPGRATGQYDLNEIHTGVSGIDGSTLPSPWTGGVKRAQNDTVPGPGQVRLGTDPAAGEADPTGYGIPILGATSSAYDPVPAADVDLGQPVIGHAVLLASNFYRYRVPYLDDYSPSTGLKYTPSGVNRRTTRETARYFQIASPANTNNSWTEEVSATWYVKSAGNFANFTQDYWTWQLARYRQNFLEKSAVGAGARLGTLLLVHFKTERDFESCARDGVMPWAGSYTVYGMTLANDPVLGPPDIYEDVVNQETGAFPAKPAPDYGLGAEPYHVVRHLGFTGNTTTPVTVVAGHYWGIDYEGPALDYTFISGVAYAIPRYRATNVNNAVISGLFASFNSAWVNGYRVDDSALTGALQVAPAQESSPNPAFVSLAHFGYETAFDSARFPVGFTDSLGYRVQRVEFPLSSAGVDAGNVRFSESNGPAAGETLTISASGPAPLASGNISFAGDLNSPAFATDAAPRVFVRRPLLSDGLQPVTATGAGQKLDLFGPLTNLLFHSTGFYHTGLGGAGGHYGNFLTGGVAYTFLSTAVKDYSERFLDEVYRIDSYFTSHADIFKKAQLIGPGMAGWSSGPIFVPVQMGRTAYSLDANWALVSWLQQSMHTLSIPDGELQVAGLPDRNPPLENGVSVPFPSSGVLIYPRTNFTSGFYPETISLQPGDAQHNYVGKTGTRIYTRCLDVAHARSSNRWGASGQTLLTLRVDGLTLEDFTYTPPGPGSTTVTNVGLAIQIKVPGLTTWMDLGRRDGDGPSKQDDALDGAGCQVIGPQTFNAVDPLTGVVYCQVQAHVGPYATLFSSLNTGAGNYEVPLLVRVVMTPTSVNYDFKKKNLGPGTFVGGADPSVWSHRVRGLVGLTVLHPDDVASPTAQQLSDWAAYLDPITGPGV